MDTNERDKSENSTAVGGLLERIVMRFRQRYCLHTFAIEDLHLTGIEPPQEPDREPHDYQAAWNMYYTALYNGEFHTKRVEWACSNCGKVFHAHCGLDITPEHGQVFRRSHVGA